MPRSVKLSDQVVADAEITARTQHRSLNKQVEHWVVLGRLAEQNPDLPSSFLADLLQGIEEAKAGAVNEYRFG